ncbi:MAG: ArsR family transcriptional regulator [Candidatus Pacebacteria bacterium GW2011_GWF2_38_9]|nr:MAG: regulatory protein ArsR [candidate division TM6 bacterium GW2011_GWF2_28_16]KKQ08834.1 MAG: ArsR family transcriptional regulator [Candidatus Pacebacteria bacterium GW2011_GWF1_36_5]KKQ89135.1 MAG: ArsR family transcriptional regulator [Candidatus Pacebacteria bacterium GW2011_GWF2_38_9]
MYGQMFALHADLLKALAHPRRLEIVNLLREQELCVSDIYEMLDLPQANISQHLMLLRDAGIVVAKREGKQIIYKLADPKIIKASDLLREVLIDQNRGLEIADELTLAMKDLLPLVHDPVCKMRLSPKTANYSTKHKDHDYYFCASGCLKKFQENPKKYAKS